MTSDEVTQHVHDEIGAKINRVLLTANDTIVHYCSGEEQAMEHEYDYLMAHRARREAYNVGRQLTRWTRYVRDFYDFLNQARRYYKRHDDRQAYESADRAGRMLDVAPVMEKSNYHRTHHTSDYYAMVQAHTAVGSVFERILDRLLSKKSRQHRD